MAIQIYNPFLNPKIASFASSQVDKARETYKERKAREEADEDWQDKFDLDRTYIEGGGKDYVRKLVQRPEEVEEPEWDELEYSEPVEYTVQPGDNLSKIAAKYNITVQNLKKDNNLISDIIQPNQKLKIGGSEIAQYTIKPGETLYGIAQKFHTTTDDLMRLNNIANGNYIWAGQKLKIDAPSRNNIASYKSEILETDDIKKLEEQLNSQAKAGYDDPITGNMDMINEWYKRHGKGEYYVIDDKKHNRTYVCKDGDIVKTFTSIHSKEAESGDFITTTKIDPKTGQIINMAGNLKTPAGLFYITRSGNYHGAPAFMRQAPYMVQEGYKDGIPNSIHFRAFTQKEADSKIANTNGCTGMSTRDLQQLSQYIKGRTACYILPVDNENYFFIRNGALQFHTKSSVNEETGKYGPDNYSHNTYSFTPIERMEFDSRGDLEPYQLEVVNKYMKGLKDNKAEIQEYLGINNDTYNQLCKVAVGILGAETTYGRENDWFSNIGRGVRKMFMSSSSSSPDYKRKYEGYGLKTAANLYDNSIGLTQMKLKLLDPKDNHTGEGPKLNSVRDMLVQFNITKDDLVYDPEKAAVATMLKLGTEYRRMANPTIDKVIASWNPRSTYRDKVLNGMSRVKIYQKYSQGGALFLSSKPNPFMQYLYKFKS